MIFLSFTISIDLIFPKKLANNQHSNLIESYISYLNLVRLPFLRIEMN